MSLPPETRVKYTKIIDSILDGADLTTITRKSIRQGIQDEVSYDISKHKVAIKELIDERFDIIAARDNGDGALVPSVETVDPVPATNGVHKSTTKSSSSSPMKRNAGTADSTDGVDDTPPPKKKRKASVDADAAFAAKLQAEEDARARPTRGGSSRKAAPVKKKKKKAKKERVTGSDDSDVDESDKPKKTTGFHKPHNLSPALANLLGETQLSRPQTTKKLWKYIKDNDLQDPKDRRTILCDAMLREVFKQDKVNMFTMTKLVSQQMYSLDE